MFVSIIGMYSGMVLLNLALSEVANRDACYFDEITCCRMTILQVNTPFKCSMKILIKMATTGQNTTFGVLCTKVSRVHLARSVKK
jgi:hypothetical protein